MASDAKNPAALAGATGLGNDDQFDNDHLTETAPKKQVNSWEDLAASITCASMRADALRYSTEILLDQLQVKILTAKSFNRQGLDDDADESLREVWRLLRVTITPVRNELQMLREGAP